MKTTLDLNDQLLTEAEALAAREHISLERLIEEALRLRLGTDDTSGSPVTIPVYHGEGGLVPGLDGRSNKALRDAAEDDT